MNLYFLRLQTYLFETPLPSLVAAIVALLLVPSLRRLDGVLLAGSALLVVLYFAYWHDGFYLGPRFFVCLLPALALWTARVFPEWRARANRSLHPRAARHERPAGERGAARDRARDAGQLHLALPQ